MRILIGNEGTGQGIGLRDALRLIHGSLLPEQLREEEKVWVTDLENKEEDELVFMPENGVFQVNSAIDLLSASKKLTIDGAGGILRGDGQDGIRIDRGNVTIRNLSFENFGIALFINADENDIANISIQNCDFIKIARHGILAGATASCRTMEHIVVCNCNFYACKFMPVLISACLDLKASGEMREIYLKDFLMRECRFLEKDNETNAEGVAVFGAMDLTNLQPGRMHADYVAVNRYYDCGIEDISFEDCEFNRIGDSSFSIVSANPGKNIVVRNVNLRHNKFVHGLGGIYIGAVNQTWGGDCIDNVLENVLIADNVIEDSRDRKKECSTSVNISNSRIEWLGAECRGNITRNVRFLNNTVRYSDWGVVVEAMHDCLDAPQPALVEGCRDTGIVIHGNTFEDCMLPVQLIAANAEGRYDILGGIGRQDSSDIIYSTRAVRNVIDDVEISDNTASGFDCFLTVTAAKACGHTMALENRVGPDIRVSGNRFFQGNRQILKKRFVTDEMLYDDAIGSGNKVTGVPHIYNLER